MVKRIREFPNVTIIGAEVSELLLEGDRCLGVRTVDGANIEGATTVICTGTFLRAVMHFGLKQVAGGRIGDAATGGISEQLAERVQALDTPVPSETEDILRTSAKILEAHLDTTGFSPALRQWLEPSRSTAG